MSDLESKIDLLREVNDERVAELEKFSPGGEGSLENAFDALKMLTYLENIAFALGIAFDAALDFEGRRATMIDKIEVKVTEMREAHEAAERRAAIVSPVTPLPNRQARRHPHG